LEDAREMPMIGRRDHIAGGWAQIVTLDDGIDAFCLLVAVALVTIIALGGRSVVRDVVAVLFTVFVPGWAVVSNWPAVARRSRVAVSIVFSLTLLALIATVTLWLHFWHPIAVTEVESVVAAAALVAALARRSHGAIEEDRVGS
jgi:uncharacterized membrane protein